MASLSLDRVRQEMVDLFLELDTGVSPAAFRLRPLPAATQAARKLGVRLPVRADWMDSYNEVRAVVKSLEALMP